MSKYGSVAYPQCYEIAKGETEVPKCSFKGNLPTGITLTGTPTATEIGSADLTIANVQLNTTAVTIGGVSHAASEAVLFSVTGAKPGKRYSVAVSTQTTSTPAAYPVRIVEMVGVDDGT